MAEFEDGEVEADFIVAADGIHSAARAQRYPDEGALPLERLAALARHRGDGARPRRALHDLGRASGAEVRRLSDRRPARTAGRASTSSPSCERPESDLARSEDWNRRGSLDDFLPQFKEWDFGWLDVPGHCGGGTRDLPLPDGGPGAPAAHGPSAGPHCSAMRRTRCTPSAPTVPPRPFSMPACWPAASGATATTSMPPCGATRRPGGPATAAIVQANRGFGPSSR